jgi:hypothetical protein
MRRFPGIILLFILTIVFATIILSIITSLVYSITFGLKTGLSLGIEGSPEIFMFLLIPVTVFQIIKSQTHYSHPRKRLIMRISLFSIIALVIFSFFRLIESRNFHFVLSIGFLNFILYTLATAATITIVDALLVKKLSFKL